MMRCRAECTPELGQRSGLWADASTAGYPESQAPSRLTATRLLNPSGEQMMEAFWKVRIDGCMGC